MDTWLIVVIVVAAVILLALLVMLPRIRARRKQAERELHSRREAVAEERRSAPAAPETRADMPDRGTDDQRFEREQTSDRESERR